MDIDEDAIRTLAKLLKEEGLGEIEVSEGDQTLRVAGQTPAVSAAAPVAQGVLPPAPVVQAPDSAVPSGAVTSPMVGTVYLQPEPDALPFVAVGDTVEVGQTIVIVEAMKVMNPIRAEAAGTVTEIRVTDGQPVEFGDILLVIQ